MESDWRFKHYNIISVSHRKEELHTDCVPVSLSGVDVSENVDVDWRSLLAELGRINGVNVVFSLFTELGRAIRPPIECDELLDLSSSIS